jgi:hypothetical protein
MFIHRARRGSGSNRVRWASPPSDAWSFGVGPGKVDVGMQPAVRDKQCARGKGAAPRAWWCKF